MEEFLGQWAEHLRLCLGGEDYAPRPEALPGSRNNMMLMMIS